MKRVAPDQLDAIAWDHNRLIEVDAELGIKVVRVGSALFYSDLEPADAEDGAA